MSRDATTFKMRIPRPNSKISGFLLFTASVLVLYLATTICKYVREQFILRKYEASVSKATAFYGHFHWNTTEPSSLLSDAWGRLFSIEINFSDKRMIFISKGNDPTKSEDDLTVEISEQIYRHSFNYNGHVNMIFQSFDSEE